MPTTPAIPRRTTVIWRLVRAREWDGGVVAFLMIVGALGSCLGVAFARQVRIDVGPKDADFVSGFRPDWERDGHTTFRWTSPVASVHLPLLVQGDGFRLRLRARRHFLEPAQVMVGVADKTVGRFEIAADPKTPYLLFEIPLPRLDDHQPFAVLFESRSQNPRPLAFALDWIEIERRGEAGAFRFLPATVVGVALLVLTAYLAPLSAGLPRSIAAVHAALGAGLLSVGAWHTPLAVQRLVTLGLLPYVATAAVAVFMVRWNRTRESLGLPSGHLAGGAVLVVLLALAVRFWLLLHPLFFYPDFQIHSLLAWRLDRDGPLRFLTEFIGHQYRYSLGLQISNGHWYAFPYPPAFYFLCWPLIGLGGYRPLTAVSIAGAVVNSLAALLVLAIARKLGARAGVALAAAAAVPVLPIFLTRLSLAYFPAILGQAVDALVVLCLIDRFEETDRLPIVLGLGLMLAGAFLTYTQSLLNFGVILPLCMAIHLTLNPVKTAWQRAAGLAAAGLLGLLISVGLFYYRYIPVVSSLLRGAPVAEESELVASGRAADPEVADAMRSEDPFVGPDFDLVRGFGKAVKRLTIFYGWFSLLVAIGVGLVAARAPTARLRAFVLAWASVYLLLNLAAGGLPGPNLVRYNKDMEFVAPLFCCGLGACGGWLWERGRLYRWLALGYATAFYVFGASVAWRLLAERTFLDR